MTTDTTPQLADQSGPIGLLAYLHTAMPHLPAVAASISARSTDRLRVDVHTGLNDFTAWLSGLGLSTPRAAYDGNSGWLTAKGTVAGTPVDLHGFASRAEVDAYMQTTTATPGEVSAALTAMATTTATAMVQQQGGAA